jgi:hypothetical protein
MGARRAARWSILTGLGKLCVEVAVLRVIARSEATKQSSSRRACALDCFAVLAMTILAFFRIQLSGFLHHFHAAHIAQHHVGTAPTIACAHMPSLRRKTGSKTINCKLPSIVFIMTIERYGNLANWSDSLERLYVAIHRLSGEANAWKIHFDRSRFCNQRQ